MSLIDLALLNVRLGLLSFGGGLGVLAEMQREMVNVYGVMEARDFATAFALGQATPGPGILFLIPIGFRAAGPLGAVVAVVSFLLPPLLLQLAVARQWARMSRNRWIRALNRALLPVSIGLVGASLCVIAAPLVGDGRAVAGVAVGAAAAIALRASPAVVVLGAGLLGFLGLL